MYCDLLVLIHHAKNPAIELRNQTSTRFLRGAPSRRENLSVDFVLFLGDQTKASDKPLKNIYKLRDILHMLHLCSVFCWYEIVC